MLHIKTILHATDFSPTADQALSVAHSLARDHGAKLVLLAVTAPQLSPRETLIPRAELQLRTEEARQRLESLAAGVTDVPVEIVAVAGDVGPTLVAEAQRRLADLIVMGTHSRAGEGRLVLGSAAEHVVRHAPCAVLTIKPGTAGGLQEEAPAAKPAVIASA